MWGIVNLAFPTVLSALVGAVIFVAERVWPGRQLPESKGWYLRAFIFNLVAFIILTSVGYIFDDYFRENAWLPIRSLQPFALQILILFLAWSFVFYWWHRAAHLNGLWHVFHQMHHSPSRIEMVTTFYKHPVEGIWETFLTGFILYQIFGASAEAGAWIGSIVSWVGFYSHSNLKTPKWTGYFIQRPEQHSIHHQLDVHKYNYADFILWDRIFGTFKEAEDFTDRCGFHGDNERRIGEMLIFKDVYK